MAALVHALVALGALGWVALLVASPLLPSSGAALMYVVGSLICHQLPERSFHIGLFQLAVCARCLGIYAGAALGVVAALGAGPAARGRTPFIPTLVAAMPTLVTVGLEWAAPWRPSNLTRALAGLPLGFMVAFVVTGALATVHYGECAPRRPGPPGPPPRHI